MCFSSSFSFFFFFNDTATTEIYTLSLHDALPIQFSGNITGTAATFSGNVTVGGVLTYDDVTNVDSLGDRKSTRLNSSHGYKSYAVFCLKKKKRNLTLTT